MDSGSAGVALVSVFSSVRRRISRWSEEISNSAAEEDSLSAELSRPKPSIGALDRRGCGAMNGDDFAAMMAEPAMIKGTSQLKWRVLCSADEKKINRRWRRKWQSIAQYSRGLEIT